MTPSHEREGNIAGRLFNEKVCGTHGRYLCAECSAAPAEGTTRDRLHDLLFREEGAALFLSDGECGCCVDDDMLEEFVEREKALVVSEARRRDAEWVRSKKLTVEELATPGLMPRDVREGQRINRILDKVADRLEGEGPVTG